MHPCSMAGLPCGCLAWCCPAGALPGAALKVPRLCADLQEGAEGSLGHTMSLTHAPLQHGWAALQVPCLCADLQEGRRACATQCASSLPVNLAGGAGRPCLRADLQA